MIYKNIQTLIGNTPLLKISKTRHGLRSLNLYAKLEYLNPFGSIRDRIAFGILRNAGNSYKKCNRVIEASSGNTAKALAMLCSLDGKKLEVATNRVESNETLRLLNFLGVKTFKINSNNSTFTIMKKLALKQNALYTYQHGNPENPKTHYNTTANEIFSDLPDIDIFVGGVGTSGSTGGICKYLRKVKPSIQIIGVIASSADPIPGLRNLKELEEVELFDKSIYSKLVEISRADAITGVKSLAYKFGILAGPSTGAQYSAIMKIFKNNAYKKPKNLVFLACDRIDGYMDYLTHNPEA